MTPRFFSSEFQTQYIYNCLIGISTWMSNSHLNWLSLKLSSQTINGNSLLLLAHGKTWWDPCHFLLHLIANLSFTFKMSSESDLFLSSTLLLPPRSSIHAFTSLGSRPFASHFLCFNNLLWCPCSLLSYFFSVFPKMSPSHRSDHLSLYLKLQCQPNTSYTLLSLFFSLTIIPI